MSDLRCGYPYIVVVEYELIPRTVLGWGVCLPNGFFTVWKTAGGGFRTELTNQPPHDAHIATKNEHLPEDKHVLDRLAAALLVSMSKETLELWTQAD